MDGKVCLWKEPSGADATTPKHFAEDLTLIANALLQHSYRTTEIRLRG